MDAVERHDGHGRGELPGSRRRGEERHPEPQRHPLRARRAGRVRRAHEDRDDPRAAGRDDGEHRLRRLVRGVAGIDHDAGPVPDDPRPADRTRDAACATDLERGHEPARPCDDVRDGHRRRTTWCQREHVLRGPHAGPAAGASPRSASRARSVRRPSRRAPRPARSTRARRPRRRGTRATEPSGQPGDEEAGVVPAGHDRRRDPARQRDEPVAAEHDVAREDELTEAHPVGLDRRRGSPPCQRRSRAGSRPPPTPRGSRRRRTPAHGCPPGSPSGEGSSRSRRSASASPSSTAPPGKTWSPAPNAIVDGRRVRSTSGPPGPSRRSDDRRRRPRDRTGGRQPASARAATLMRRASSASSASGSVTGRRQAKSRQT